MELNTFNKDRKPQTDHQCEKEMIWRHLDAQRGWPVKLRLGHLEELANSSLSCSLFHSLSSSCLCFHVLDILHQHWRNPKPSAAALISRSLSWFLLSLPSSLISSRKPSFTAAPVQTNAPHLCEPKTSRPASIQDMRSKKSARASKPSAARCLGSLLKHRAPDWASLSDNGGVWGLANAARRFRLRRDTVLTGLLQDTDTFWVGFWFSPWVWRSVSEGLGSVCSWESISAAPADRRSSRLE